MTEMRPTPPTPQTGVPAVPLSLVGAPGGVAELGPDGKILASEIPTDGVVPDATVASKGVVQLAGDLAGTAAAPTVPGLAAKQPLDADLTVLAGLDSSTAGVPASDGGGWIKKTYAQLKAALGIVAGDVAGLGTAATVDTGTTAGTIPLLGVGGRLAIARVASGAPDGTKFVRDDGTLATPSGGGGPTAIAGPGKSLQSGLYTPVLAGFGNTAQAGFTGGTMFAFPFRLVTAATLDRIGVQVGAVAAGSTIRLGVYSDTGAGYPGALLAEFTTGTQLDSSTAGIKELTVSQALAADTLYWLAYLAQGGTPQVIVLNSGIAWHTLGMSSQAAAANPGNFSDVLGWSHTGLAAGAMPANFTAARTGAQVGQVPNVYCRAV